jgi:hypothetical protein
MRLFLPRLCRATAMLLVALWAVQPVATWVHSSEHIHRYCAEHQAFEEGGSRTEGARGVVAASSAQLTAGTTALDESGPRPHERCNLPACGARVSVLPAVGMHLPAPPLEARAVAPPARSVPAPPLAVLDLAPKASPPSRA